MESAILVAILFIVFAPRFLPVFGPVATQSSAIYLVLGTLQILLGIALYAIFARKGYIFPWPLVVCLYGSYYVWRGWQLRKSASAIPRSGSRSGGGIMP